MWCTSFCPSDMCNWTEVPNFKQWKAAEYTGEGGITAVLRKAVDDRPSAKCKEYQVRPSAKCDQVPSATKCQVRLSAN